MLSPSKKVTGENLIISFNVFDGGKVRKSQLRKFQDTGSPSMQRSSGPGPLAELHSGAEAVLVTDKVQARMGDYETAEEAGVAAALERICALESRLRQAIQDTHNLTSSLTRDMGAVDREREALLLIRSAAL